MKCSRSYPTVRRHWYRPVEHECHVCHRTLRQAKTLSKRTVIRLGEVIKVTHAGYRCPDPDCPGYQRTYRSPMVSGSDTYAARYRFVSLSCMSMSHYRPAAAWAAAIWRRASARATSGRMVLTAIIAAMM